jgi:flagellar basal-body rod protein FlgG
MGAHDERRVSAAGRDWLDPQNTEHITISSSGDERHRADWDQSLGKLQLYRFANPGGLDSMGKNLYRETTASGAAIAGNPDENGFGSLRQGYLEMSNVKVVEEMVNMIVAQRAYEVNSKAVQAADEMMQLANNLRR